MYICMYVCMVCMFVLGKKYVYKGTSICVCVIFGDNGRMRLHTSTKTFIIRRTICTYDYYNKLYVLLLLHSIVVVVGNVDVFITCQCFLLLS